MSFARSPIAAAVHYGWDAWPFSDRSSSSSAWRAASNWNDPWRKTTGEGKKIPFSSLQGADAVMDHLRRKASLSGSR
jgi:hypothetical protein